MDYLIELLNQSPLLLLFLVLAIGAPLGKIKIRGVNLGIASILFTGLAFGALSPSIKLPAVIYEFGLVLFIYCIGISSGEQFFRNFKRKGWIENIAAVSTIGFVFVCVWGLSIFTSIKQTYLVGIFAGSLTNTPALAASLEYIKNVFNSASIEKIITEPVVAYSVCYPMGVIGMILSIVLFQKLTQTSLRSTDEVSEAEKITNATVLVTTKKFNDTTIEDIKKHYHLDVVFGRLKRQEMLAVLVKEHHTIQEGDLLTVVGKKSEIEKTIKVLGAKSDIDLQMDHQNLSIRRIFVSNHALIGQNLSDLNLPHTMGMIITRIRRGDHDFVPQSNTTLQFGDRVRVLTGHDDIKKASHFFGDSYAAQSEIDILTLSLGVSVGFFVGMLPIPLPGGIILKLGMAGGPLIVALLLGSINRIGRLVFVMPYSANSTIRQLGLVLFLAGVGTRSGYAFRETLTNSNDGMLFFLIGLILTVTVTFFFLSIGHYFFKIPFPKLAGMLSGIQTQPAVLAFVSEQAKSEQPNIGYSSVFPIATLTKIILAQVLLTLLT